MITNVPTVGVASFAPAGGQFAHVQRGPFGQQVRKQMQDDEEDTLNSFGRKMGTLFDGWRTRVEKITLDSRYAQGP